MIKKILNMLICIFFTVIISASIGTIVLIMFTELGTLTAIVFLFFVMLLWACLKFGGRRR